MSIQANPRVARFSQPMNIKYCDHRVSRHVGRTCQSAIPRSYNASLPTERPATRCSDDEVMVDAEEGPSLEFCVPVFLCCELLP